MSDGWERSRERPRSVRSIFAEGAARPAHGEERWAPLPGLLEMPRRLLGLLPRALRLPVVLALAAAVVVIPLVGVAVRQETERREAARQRAEISARQAALRADQAPRSARLAPEDTAVAALERYVSADVRERQAAGVIGGTTARTACRRPRGPTAVSPRSPGRPRARAPSPRASTSPRRSTARRAG